MKKIKVLFILIWVSLFSVQVTAQEKIAEFGLLTGYSFTVPKLKNAQSLPGFDTRSLNGVHIGPMLKLNIDEQFAINIGTLFNYFGGVYLEPSQAVLKKLEGTWNESKTMLTAFDLPLKLSYSVELADDFHFMVFAGPNFNYAFSKNTVTNYYANKKLSKSVGGNDVYKTDNFNSFDLQAGAGLGAQWMNYSIRASFEWGFLNRTIIENAQLNGNDIKITLGYTF